MVNLMKISTISVLLALLLFVNIGSAASVIVINETEEKVFALDSVTLSGNLQNNVLTVIGNGEILSGENVKVYLFGPSSDLLIRNLEVNNEAKSVSFDKSGYYFLQDKGKFDFTGLMEIRTLGQLNLKVPGPMNELKFDLTNGYAISGDRFGLIDDTIVIQRTEDVAMLVDGSFRFTYAEKDEFYYVLNFKAFGSDIGRYKVDLLNGETVSKVSGALKWEQSGNKLILDLSGSEKTVSVSGIFDSTNLRVPLPEEKHHVLIEADAEKKLTLSTSAKEIDLTESSLLAQYPNARAFLAERSDNFKIQIKELGLLPSLAAAVRQATHTIAITEKGSIVGEMQYSYANTGVDYIEVDAPGTALYASTASGPVKLTEDEKLLLSFPKSQYGNFDFVYFTTRGKMMPIDFISVPLAKTDLPISNANTQIYLPKDYYVLETFGAPGGSELPAFKSMALFAVLVGGLAFALKKKSSFVFGSLVFGAGLYAFNISLFYLVVAAAIVYKVRDHFKDLNWKPVLIAGAVLAVLVIGFAGLSGLTRSSGSWAGGSVQYGMAEADVEMTMAPRMKAMDMIGDDEEAAISVPTREGVLPVKLEIPRLGKTISIQNALVTKENPLELQVLLISKYFMYFFYLIAAYFGMKSYKQLK